MPTDMLSYYSTGKSALDRCRAYVAAQSRSRKRPPARRGLDPGGPAITVSYEAGTAAHVFAPRLAEILQKSEPAGAVRWTIFDRQLVDQVLAELHLPKELGALLSEDRRSYIRDVLSDEMGARTASWVVAPMIAETVLHLVATGHVILVGRGANVITRRMPNVLHVRLIGSLPARIARLQEMRKVSPREAAKIVREEDRAHTRYAQAHFHVNPSDVLSYHVVLNTDEIPVVEAARMIANAAQGFFERAKTQRP
jgi:cytidylate kinase